MSIRNEILEKIAEVAGERGGDIAAEALYAIAKDKRADGDELTGVVINIAASWSRRHGPEVASDLMDKLIVLLGSNVNDLSNMAEMDAFTLSQLVEAYQQAEVGDIKKTKKWGKRVADILRVMGKVIGPALIGAL